MTLILPNGRLARFNAKTFLQSKNDLDYFINDLFIKFC